MVCEGGGEGREVGGEGVEEWCKVQKDGGECVEEW